MKITLLLSASFISTTLMAQLALSPSEPAIQGTSTVFVPGSPAITPPQLSTASTVPALTNLTVEQLSSLLTNLQSTLEQTLPLLTAFTDGFDFVPVASNGEAPVTPLALGASTNLGTRFSRQQAASTLLPNSGTVTTSNSLAIPPGFANFEITRDTVRQLLILQNDIARMLPGLNALNGGNNTSALGQ